VCFACDKTQYIEIQTKLPVTELRHFTETFLEGQPSSSAGFRAGWQRSRCTRMGRSARQTDMV